MFRPLDYEEKILKFWQENKIYQKAKQKNANGKNFYFLDGPPYTTGEVHLGTAWNKVLKDCILRYKRMRGFNVWDRAGYDMHGIPIEHKVEEKLGITKLEIPKFGVERFVEACKEFALENLKKMSEDFKRLGVWMDFDNPYMTIKNEFIEGEWWLIKQAFKNGRLYRGKKVMHWCPRCATALAKHELSYETRKDDSVYLKFKIKNSTNEYLVVWTTTPWTIAFNLAIMANPEQDYVKIKVDVDGKEEIWIVAKALVNALLGMLDKNYTVIETLKGKSLEGIKYEHPFYEELKEVYDKIAKECANLHSVVLSAEYVDVSSGSGLVHCAPGCGPEDYEVGKRYGLIAFNELDETGHYKQVMGKFSGWDALKDNPRFLEELKKKGVVIAVTPVEHEYAHCWRCKSPVVFRATEQWFFKIEDLVAKMRDLNKEIFWQPGWAGSRWFDSWLASLRDNSITRQRYWGAPLPIWKCKQCGNFVVIESREELKKYTSEIPKDLHRPYIDKIKFSCQCGGTMEREPDVLDVWIDAGTTSWTCLDYPQKKDLFEKLWPADLIIEGKDQIRGWFNLLFIASMLAFERHCYKAVYMHGFINDALGRKMSKSLGNYISPSEVIDKYGADTFRFYTIGGTDPGLDLNYNFNDIEVKFRNLSVLYNIARFLVEYANEIPQDVENLDIEERYMLSRLHSTIKCVTELFEKYKLNEVPWEIESLFLELSRFYIQLTREKIHKKSEVVCYTIFNVLLNLLKLFAPICPFTTEEIYQQLKNKFGLQEESIHLCNWPGYEEKLIDKNLEEDVALVKEIIKQILAGREKAKLGIRWPLKQAIITCEKNLKDYESLIKTQANVKEVIWQHGNFAVEIDTQLTPELEQEGYARELTRLLQELRKKAGLKKEEKARFVIIASYKFDPSGIAAKVNASSIEVTSSKPSTYEASIAKKIRDYNFEVFLVK